MTHCASELNFPSPGLGWVAPSPVRIDIETPRLNIRGYTLGDAQEVFEVIHDSLDHLMPWMPWAPGHTSVAFTTKYIAEQIMSMTAGPNFTNVGVGIFEKDTGSFVGGTGVHDVRRDTASCETGYWIRHDRVGHGYAREACAHALSWALGEQTAGGLGLRRVRVYCSSANAPSAKIPERLGLTAEVRQRQDYYIEGIGPTDRLGWGVMANEWDCKSHQIVQA